MNILELILSGSLSWGCSGVLSAYDMAGAAKLYQANCVICHGESGEGNGPAGQYMNPRPRNFTKDKFIRGDKPDEIAETIRTGFNQMPPFGNLSPEDRINLANYIKGFRK